MAIRRYLYLPVLICCIGFSVYAQEHKMAFVTYDAQNGFPMRYPRDILQDDLGFMWISTGSGLVKFDGFEMQVFRPDIQDSSSLLLRSLSSLMLTRKKDIVIGALDGIATYNQETGKFTNHFATPDDSTKMPYPVSLLLFEDVAENVWFVNRSLDGRYAICRLHLPTQEVHAYDFRKFGLESFLIQPPMNSVVHNFSVARSKADSSFWITLQNEGRGYVFRYDNALGDFEIAINRGDTIPGTSSTQPIEELYPLTVSGYILMGESDNLHVFDPIKREVVETYNFPNPPGDGGYGASFEDEYGTIWRTSGNRINLIKPELGVIDYVELGGEQYAVDGFPDAVDWMIPVLHDSSEVWFEITSMNQSTVSYLNYRFSEGTFTHYDQQFNHLGNDPGGRQKGLFRDASGILWLVDGRSVYKQDPKKEQFVPANSPVNTKNDLPLEQIRRVHEDSNGYLWIGTRKGFAVMDSTGQVIISNEIGGGKSFFEDSKGKMWVDSDAGLFRWDQTDWSSERVSEDAGGQIQEDKQGNIWIAPRLPGIMVLNPDDEVIYTLPVETFFGPLIFHDSEGSTWIGNYPDTGELSRLDEPTGKPDPVLTAANGFSSKSKPLAFIVEDAMQNLWLGGEKLVRYNPGEHSFEEIRYKDVSIEPTGFLMSNDDILWVSSAGYGLLSVDLQTDIVRSYGEKEGFLSENTDPLWNSQLMAKEIFQDELGQLWLNSFFGIAVFDPQTGTVKNYRDEDGLESYAGAIAMSGDGKLWLGNNEGLYHINPKDLNRKNPKGPLVQIHSITINDSTYTNPDGSIFKSAVTHTGEINLTHDQKDVAFEFVALHYLRQEQNQYSWKLENYDDRWSEPSLSRTVNYTNLSPGTYTFRVKGANADGVWNEEGASMRVIIHPPIWQTGWAYGFYAILFFAGLYALSKVQQSRVIRKERERSQKKELEQAREIEKAYVELKNTQSQLIHAEKMASLGELTAGIAHEIQNPLNFVNNFSDLSQELVGEMKEEIEAGNLNDVKEISEDLDQNLSKINTHGKRASEIVRGMLEHSRAGSGVKEMKDINALADEYLRLAYHGLRAKDPSFKADFELNLGEDLSLLEVVPQDMGRVLLNIFNNAFHATEDVEHAKVTVQTRQENGQVEILVTDNGGGIPENIIDKIFQPFFTTKDTGKGTGLGLSLSYDIITKGHGGTLSVESTEGKGSTFKIVLPVDAD